MKIAIGIIVAILVVGAGYFLFVNKSHAPVQNPATTETNTSADAETINPAGTVETGSPDAQGMGAAGQPLVTVTYTDTGFSPKTVNVPAGTTVRFVNNSTGTMWIGSNDHPTHSKYDGTTLEEHCANKTSFDQCGGAPAGGTYDFTFTKVGTFGYHNHAHTNSTGSVVVQ